MHSKLYWLLAVAAGSALSTAARADLVHFKYSHLQRVEDRRICLTFAHEPVAISKARTNTTAPISCRLRLWPALVGKAEDQAFDEHEASVTRWGVFPFGEKREECFDFSDRLLLSDRIAGVGRLSVQCVPESKATKTFANLRRN